MRKGRKVKSRKHKKKKSLLPKISPKQAFKKSSQLGTMSPSELQEWTGQSTHKSEGFPGLPDWPSHDWSSRAEISMESEAAKNESFTQVGRTFPDLLHMLFIGGQLGYLLMISWVGIFGVILWQDNTADKLDTFNGILWSLAKGGIWACVLLLLFFIIRIGIWIRNR